MKTSIVRCGLVAPSVTGIPDSRPAGWLAVLLLALTLTVPGVLRGDGAPSGAPASTPSPRAANAVTTSPWGRIVMVGASATAGFTESEPLGGPTTPHYRLSLYLDAAIRVAHEPVLNLANSMFFVEPESAGRYQVQQALEARPTVVVGVDFLFWFCYGEGRTDQERLQRFAKGLKLLEAVQCPLILGDLPDASAATNDILSAEEIPSGTALAAANRRLKEWAADRRQVTVVSLSGFMRAVLANQALTVHGRTLPVGKTRTLLQDDKLHPSPAGSAVLALVVLDAIQSTRFAPSAGDVCWDPREVYRLGFNPSQDSAGRTSPGPHDSAGSTEGGDGSVPTIHHRTTHIEH
jgi:hypothetical protein